MTSCYLREKGLIEIAGGLIPVSQAAAYEACEGRTDPCHLVPQQKIKQRFPHGAVKVLAEWLPILRGTTPDASRATMTAHEICKLTAIIVPGCRRHHKLMDESRKLRIPREALPESVEQFASEFGFQNYLEREYGPLTRRDEAA